MRNLPASLVIVWAAIGCSESTSPANDIPGVEQRPSGAPPPLPADLKVACPTSAAGLDLAATCPVIVWKGRTYWALSFRDNRPAIGVVGFEGATPTGRRDLAGARYIWQIAVDRATTTITFVGQGNDQVTMSWSELP